MASLLSFVRLHLDMLRGGMSIDTPARSKAPVLRTVIQFDGDILNIVFSDENGRLPEAALLARLFETHKAALGKRIDRVAQWQAWAARARKSAPFITGASGIGSSASWWLAHPVFAWGGVGLALAPYVFRFGAPLVARPLFNVAVLLVARDRKRENQKEHDRLNKLRTRPA